MPGTRLAEICGTEPFTGFHWCSYGLADGFVERLEAAGVVVSARAPDAGVEGIELPGAPLLRRDALPAAGRRACGRPLHPLIGAFVDAARGLVRR